MKFHYRDSYFGNQTMSAQDLIGNERDNVIAGTRTQQQSRNCDAASEAGFDSI